MSAESERGEKGDLRLYFQKWYDSLASNELREGGMYVAVTLRAMAA